MYEFDRTINFENSGVGLIELRTALLVTQVYGPFDRWIDRLIVFSELIEN